MLGNLALGIFSIAIGLNQISSGVKRIKNGGKQRQRPRRNSSGRGMGSTLTSTQVGNTGIGRVRLRTYQIKNLEDRIRHLKGLVDQGKKDPVIYEFARRAVNQRCGPNWCVPEKNNGRELQALFKAIRNNVRYTSDITRVDSYQKPRHTLALRGGDCDDYAVLTCAAANSIGLPCRFKVIRTRGAPEWNHIFAQIGLPRRQPSRWISADASVNMPLGWEAPRGMVEDSKVFST